MDCNGSAAGSSCEEQGGAGAQQRGQTTTGAGCGCSRSAPEQDGAKAAQMRCSSQAGPLARGLLASRAGMGGAPSAIHEHAGSVD